MKCFRLGKRGQTRLEGRRSIEGKKPLLRSRKLCLADGTFSIVSLQVDPGDENHTVFIGALEK